MRWRCGRSAAAICRLHCRKRMTTLSNEAAQERCASGHIGKTVFSGLPFDGEPAPILDFFEPAEIVHPVDVAVAERHFLSGSAGTGLPSVLGVRVDDSAAKGLDAGVGIKAMEQQIGGIKIDAKASGIESVEEGSEECPILQPSFQGKR